MADDRKKRPHRDYGFPRAKSQPGIPSVEIDPEKTPLPAAPPGPEAFAILPIAAKVDALHHVVQEQSAAIERVWDARHVSDRIDRLETAQVKLADNVAADTQQVTGLIVKVEQWGEMTKKAFDKSNALSEKQIALDTQLGIFFNKQFPEYLEEVKTSNALLRSVQQRVDDVEDEVEDVKAKLAEHDEALATLDKRVAKFERADTEKVIRSDERRRWLSYVTKGRALVAAAITTAVGIATYLATH